MFIHATGRRGVAKAEAVRDDIRQMSADVRLHAILEQGQILPFDTYYSGGEPVVCLTEASEEYFARLVTEKGHQPWAVLLDPDRLPAGVKPVRYHHRDDMSAEAGWRTVDYQWGHINWMWEREWRWRGPAPLPIRDAAVAVLIDDPNWPDLVEVTAHAPDGSAELRPAVPAWAEDLDRFLWDAEDRDFKRIGPREVPPYKYAEAGVTYRRQASGRTREFGVTRRELVWLDDRDTDQARRELLQDAEENLSDWLRDQCPNENCDWGEVSWLEGRGDWGEFEYGTCESCGTTAVRCGNCDESHPFVWSELECFCGAEYSIEHDSDGIELGVVQLAGPDE